MALLIKFRNFQLFVILVISTLTYAEKINVTLIYSSADEESLNFFKTEWTQKQNDTFKKYINWDLELYTPYTAKPNEHHGRDYSFKPEHGEQEVLGNKYHECAKKSILNNYKLIQFIKCYAKNTIVDADNVKLPDTRDCSVDSQLQSSLKLCVEGADVINSMVNSTSNIKKLKLEIKMPIISVDGKYHNYWNGKFDEFVTAVCKEILEKNQNVTDVCNSVISNIYVNTALFFSMLTINKIVSF